MSGRHSSTRRAPSLVDVLVAALSPSAERATTGGTRKGVSRTGRQVSDARRAGRGTNTVAARVGSRCRLYGSDVRVSMSKMRRRSHGVAGTAGLASSENRRSSVSLVGLLLGSFSGLLLHHETLERGLTTTKTLLTG